MIWSNARLYQLNEGKMNVLVARFGDHTDAIFKRHNMKSIGYWVLEAAPYSQNLFVYIPEHPSREEAAKNCAVFQGGPEWKKVKGESQAQGPLTNRMYNSFMGARSFY